MEPAEQKKLAQKIVRKVLDDLLDRKGFRQEWDGCDQQTKIEIRNRLREIVERELRHNL